MKVCVFCTNPYRRALGGHDSLAYVSVPKIVGVRAAKLMQEGESTCR